MNDLVETAWHYRTQQVSQPVKVQVRPTNKRLATELLGVSGQYLSCILPRTGDSIRFYFRVRHEEKGFLKLDLQPDLYQDCGIIGGYDLTHISASRFLMASENYFQARNTDYLVPAVCFGMFGEYGFYIESMYGFARVEPFFIRASHQFIALALTAIFGADRPKLSEYTQLLSSGQDPLQLLEREPLMRTIVRMLPDESRKPFFSQLGSELYNIAEQSGLHKVRI